MSDSPVIIFAESDGGEHTIQAPANGTLLDAALTNSLPHLHDCGGKARCSTCRVRVLEGLENLSTPTTQEVEIASTYAWTRDIRLACQARVLGNVRVERLVVNDRRTSEDGEVALSSRSEERPLAVLFCDVSGFTDFASGMMPYDVVHVVNRLFLRMGEGVLAESGYIDKYLGDGLLALWGINGGAAPEICLAAVRSGLLMQRSVNVLQSQLAEHFGGTLSLRVGIHYGPAIIGKIGHPARQQVTAIGDTVNVASRVEGANKDLRTTFLITEECYREISDRIIVGDDFKTVLRGQSRPRRLFEVAGLVEPDPIFIAQRQLPIITAAGETFVKTFYRHLFALSPEIRALFDQSEMPRQHLRFIEVFSWAIRELRHRKRLVEGLIELGTRHRTYGVLEDHYQIAAQALLQALAEVLGPDFDAKAEEAWTQIFFDLAKAMQTRNG